MIKKLLLAIIPCMLAIALHAQTAGNESVMLKSYKAERLTPSFHEPMHDFSSAHYTSKKGTATGGSRWMVPFEMTDAAYLNGALNGNRFVFYIDWDSTLYQKFSNVTTNNGYAAVNWVGIAQFVDPIWSTGFTSIVDNYATTDNIYVIGANPYTVDSIGFLGAYMQGITGGNVNTVDTLFFSVAPIPYDSFRTYTVNDTPTTIYGKVINYDEVSSHNGEMRLLRLNHVDTNTRQLTFDNAIRWKVPLDTSFRKPKDANGQFPTKGYSYPVPNGGLQVPPGWGYAVSVAFKPGEAWSYQDSVTRHHYFMPIASQASDGVRMPYYYYNYNDRNMSYLMHNAGINRFSSSLGIEMANSDDFDKEFVWLGGHITCASCWDLSVAKGNNNLLTARAYPNPANSELNIPVTLITAADVHVSLMNTVGQVVATQTVKNITNGKAVFNTSSLNSGIYFYTVEAGGERKTGRVTIAH